MKGILILILYHIANIYGLSIKYLIKQSEITSLIVNQKILLLFNDIHNYVYDLLCHLPLYHHALFKSA